MADVLRAVKKSEILKYQCKNTSNHAKLIGWSTMRAFNTTAWSVISNEEINHETEFGWKSEKTIHTKNCVFLTKCYKSGIRIIEKRILSNFQFLTAKNWKIHWVIQIQNGSVGYYLVLSNPKKLYLFLPRKFLNTNVLISTQKIQKN